MAMTAKVLDVERLTSAALTTVTHLIAESEPRHKKKTVPLVVTLISRKVTSGAGA